MCKASEHLNRVVNDLLNNSVLVTPYPLGIGFHDASCLSPSTLGNGGLEMNPDEFTEPFDLERFKAGEPAMTDLHHTAIFKSYGIEDIYWMDAKSKKLNLNSLDWALQYWRMKPKTDDGWIKHDGGECPIPWAKSGEFDVQLRGGFIENISAPELVSWQDAFQEASIIAYRLTDGWIPVKGDGTIPAQIKGAKSGEWEYKLACGKTGFSCDIAIASNRWWTQAKTNDPYRVVAVRLVKQIPDELKEGMRKASEKNIKLAEQLIENQTRGLRQAQETEKQRLTREAWTRYKAAHPDPVPVPALGESGIEAIFTKAFWEHDKHWPRKR
jgi:hypothetical protein